MGSIGPYTIVQELSNKDAGSSEWGFVQKNGREYHIKKFPSPKYPLSPEDIGKELFEKKRQKADAFFNEKKAFYTALKKCESGNNIIVRDFFREGPSFYAVTDKVTCTPITIREIAKLNDDKKTVLISAIFYSIMLLHENGIVHADIKPDNLIIKRTERGYFTAKIVDFDAGFFANNPPKKIVGDFVYLAPETYLQNEGMEAYISEKIDIFALGLLLHQYWTGRLPEMGDDSYAFLHVLNDGILKADEHIPPRLKRTIEEMLDRDPEKRPSAKVALARLTNKPMML